MNVFIKYGFYFNFRYNVLDEEEIQGEEDGVSGMDGDVKVNIDDIQVFFSLRSQLYFSQSVFLFIFKVIPLNMVKLNVDLDFGCNMHVFFLPKCLFFIQFLNCIFYFHY